MKEGISIIDQGEKLFKLDFSVSSFFNQVGSVHFLKTHFPTMSFEEEVTEFEEVDCSAAVSIQSEHVLDDIVDFLRGGFSKNISDNLLNS